MGKKRAGPYKRPNNINKYYIDENLRDSVRISNETNTYVTASNTEKVSFIDSSYQNQRRHKIEIEKRINSSKDIQNLMMYLASISLCLGKI